MRSMKLTHLHGSMSHDGGRRHPAEGQLEAHDFDGARLEHNSAAGVYNGNVIFPPPRLLVAEKVIVLKTKLGLQIGIMSLKEKDVKGAETSQR